MKRKEKDEQFAAHLPGVLQYHQTMLADGVRNKLLYEALIQNITTETNFLDIGAGTGVWAILAAKLGAKRVVAVEIEECLIPIIYKHAKENGVADKIEIIHGNSNDVKIRGKFELIVSELFGGDALGAETVKSFVALRNRFLAPGGVLIPMKMAMFAVPVHLERSINELPAELPFSMEFLKAIKLNYAQNFLLPDRKHIRFLAKPHNLIELDFGSIEEPPSMEDLSASWKIENVSEANAIATFNRSTFTETIEMDTFGSKSWGVSIHEFVPFQQESGELAFRLTLDPQNGNWSVALPSNPEIKVQTFSPVFAFTRIRMAQKMTPHKKFNPPGKEKQKGKQTHN